MGIKRRQPEEIVTKLRQVEVVVGRGLVSINSIRQTSIADHRAYPSINLQQRLSSAISLFQWFGRLLCFMLKVPRR